MNYSIRDLEKITGIKTHTIRIWEQRYDLVKPQRTDTNIRFYSDSDLKYLINVSLLNKTGHKISKIAKMNQSEIYENIQNVAVNERSDQYFINELIKSTIDMDEKESERIITSCVARFGFQQTIETVLFPFLKRLGFLWHTSSINVAQEHMISNIIRRKILVATDAVVGVMNPTKKTIILFLPAWESHELGLLYCEYILRKQGHKVYYLGASMPVDELQDLVKTLNVDYILGFLTLNASERKMTKFLNEYGSLENVTKLISCHSSNKIKDLSASLETDIHFVDNLEELNRHF